MEHKCVRARSMHEDEEHLLYGSGHICVMILFRKYVSEACPINKSCFKALCDY